MNEYRHQRNIEPVLKFLAENQDLFQLDGTIIAAIAESCTMPEWMDPHEWTRRQSNLKQLMKFGELCTIVRRKRMLMIIYESEWLHVSTNTLKKCLPK